ncbi:hydroxyacid-oxoacid transhydrogenase, mitochondrial, partial [Paramuricea clavata]
MSKTVSREAILRVLRLLSGTQCSCPAHSQAFSHHGHRHASVPSAEVQQSKEYAFEMASSSIRYGAGVTQEVGMDFKNMGAKNVCVVTDKKLSELPPVFEALNSLCVHGVKHNVFDNVRIEPTDESFQEAINFAKEGDFDCFLAVGGGSVMDTAKAANLYSSCPENEFLDFVNAPIGKGLPVTKPLKPLIA